MTKREIERCDKAARNAYNSALKANMAYKDYEKAEKENNPSAPCYLRQADQFYGKAEGMYDALSVIGYKGELMSRIYEELNWEID